MEKFFCEGLASVLYVFEGFPSCLILSNFKFLTSMQNVMVYMLTIARDNRAYSMLLSFCKI